MDAIFKTRNAIIQVNIWQKNKGEEPRAEIVLIDKTLSPQDQDKDICPVPFTFIQNSTESVDHRRKARTKKKKIHMHWEVRDKAIFAYDKLSNRKILKNPLKFIRAIKAFSQGIVRATQNLKILI